MLKNRKLFAAVVITVSVLCTTFSFYFWQVAKSPNLNVQGEKDFVLYIPTGGDYKNVVDSLHKYKIINDEVSFQFLSKWLKYPQSVKAGRYVIKPNTGNRELLLKLRLGEQSPVKLTFNNVRLKSDLIQKIGNKFEFDNNELITALQDPAVCQKYGFDTTTVMAMFLPNTYLLNWTISPEKFLGRMNHEFNQFWTDERKAKAKAIGLDPIKVSVMASIVQSETNKKDEMPRVAGAYMNRLNIDMPLQADPTVKFAVGDFSLRRILEKHLAISSPYNTYRNTGLPPGPIALPEPHAIDAVLDYEKHSYIYFCAKEDFSGYHNFAVSYQDHLNNAKIYQEALNKRNIK